jgi:hypothetical protein
MPISKVVICCVPGGTMLGGLGDFQSFRADLNEEILGCGHLGVKRFFAWITRLTSRVRWVPRRKSYWA